MGRDYTYVDDIVAGVVASLECVKGAKVPFEVFNLGNSHPARLAEMIAQMEAATGKKIVVETVAGSTRRCPHHIGWRSTEQCDFWGIHRGGHGVRSAEFLLTGIAQSSQTPVIGEKTRLGAPAYF
jgi:nucleoside-diphosphate-sugar epimerase